MDQESIQELAPEEALDSPKGGPAETEGLTQSTPLNSLEVRIPVNPSHSGHNSPLRSYHETDKQTELRDRSQGNEILASRVAEREHTKCRPQSREKRCCSRKHRHPSGRLLRVDQSSSQLGTFIDTKEGGTTTTPELPSKESNSSCTTRLDDPHRRKPSSRPKRKCRFGPRSRHHHRVKSREAIPNSPPFCTVNGDDSHREKKVYLPNPSHTLVNSPPQVFQRLPDRVTLQPGSFPRRTPFDQYKKQSGDLRTEVNSTKHATFRLGISEKAFTEELEKELNDLLTEIETTRRGEQDYTELKCPEGKGSNVCLPCLPGDFSQQRQGKQNKGRKAPAPSKTPLPPKGQQSKGLLGSRPKRGRVRERTSPTCRDPPPPPPPRRSPVPIGTDEKVSNLPDER